MRIYFLLFIFCLSSGFSFQFKTLRKYLPKDPTILDCGAKDGRSSILLLNAFPEAKVIAVEADPINFEVLVEKVKSYENIIPLHYALADKIGTIEFYQNQNPRYNAQGSILKPSKDNWFWPKIKLNDKATIVPATTLDALFEELCLEHVDFLYLDMQGAELMMLKASKKIFSTCKLVISEVSFKEVYDGCPLYDEFKSFMEQMGFREVKLIRRHHSWGDALYVKEEKK